MWHLSATKRGRGYWVTKWTTTSWEWRSIIWTWRARQRRQGDCEWRGTARFGHLPIRQAVEEPVWEPWQWSSHTGNFQGIWKVMGILQSLWNVGIGHPFFWLLKGLTLAVVFAYFSTGDDAQAANQVKMAQILEFTHSIRTPFAIAADFNIEPDQLWETGWVQSLGQRASIVVPEVGHTCTTGRGRIIDFAVISDSVQPFWRGITPEYNSPCKPHIGTCLQVYGHSHTGPREAGLLS